MDAVQKANSGHPGLPMGMAPAAYLLYQRVMRHNPRDPAWPDRDRFVLSARATARCCSTRCCTSSGYDALAGRPQALPPVGLAARPATPSATSSTSRRASRSRPGRSARASPTASGMAMAERFLRERYGAEVQDHRIYAIVSDGDLMEGIASEAASLAGHLGARPPRLPLRRQQDLARRPDLAELRPRTSEALRGLRLARRRGRRRQRPRRAGAAIDRGSREEERPSLIRVRSIIGYPAPNKQGTSKAPRRAAGRGRGARRRRRRSAGIPTSTSSCPRRSTST